LFEKQINIEENVDPNIYLKKYDNFDFLDSDSEFESTNKKNLKAKKNLKLNTEMKEKKETKEKKQKQLLNEMSKEKRAFLNICKNGTLEEIIASFTERGSRKPMTLVMG
jgi:hypothetical protein